MLYIKVNAALEVCGISNEYPENAKPGDWHRKADGTRGFGWMNRNDIDNMKTAITVARNCTAWAASSTKIVYMADDRGPSVSPRFDVVRAPAVGDDVSKGFNGDYYPVGKIVRMTPISMRVITVDGPRGKLKFWRNGARASWTLSGGTWGLAMGIHNDQNPHV